MRALRCAGPFGAEGGDPCALPVLRRRSGHSAALPVAGQEPKGSDSALFPLPAAGDLFASLVLRRLSLEGTRKACEEQDRAPELPECDSPRLRAAPPAAPCEVGAGGRAGRGQLWPMRLSDRPRLEVGSVPPWRRQIRNAGAVACAVQPEIRRQRHQEAPEPTATEGKTMKIRGRDNTAGRWSRVWFWPVPPDVEVSPEAIEAWLKAHPEDRPH
jgi:hypothetical protein